MREGLHEHVIGVKARRDDAVVHHGLLDDVDAREVFAGRQPDNVAWVVDMVVGRA